MRAARMEARVARSLTAATESNEPVRNVPHTLRRRRVTSRSGRVATSVACVIPSILSDIGGGSQRVLRPRMLNRAILLGSPPRQREGLGRGGSHAGCMHGAGCFSARWAMMPTISDAVSHLVDGTSVLSGGTTRDPASGSQDDTLHRRSPIHCGFSRDCTISRS